MQLQEAGTTTFAPHSARSVLAQPTAERTSPVAKSPVKPQTGGNSPESLRRRRTTDPRAPTAMARLERGEHKRRIQSEAGRALLSASRVGSGAAGDDAQYLAAAGYDPLEIRMALGMLEEARAVYMRLSATNKNGTSSSPALHVEDLDAASIERELESMVVSFALCLNFSLPPSASLPPSLPLSLSLCMYVRMQQFGFEIIPTH